MRSLRLVSSCVLLLALAHCGSGGGTTGGTESLALVQGKVTARDASPADLSGVEVHCLEAASADVTDDSGFFEVAVPSGHPFHLHFRDPSAPDVGTCREGRGEHADAHPEELDIDGSVVLLGGVGPGESCEVEVRIERGGVAACYVRRDGPDGASEDGEEAYEEEGYCEGVGRAADVEVRVVEGCLHLELDMEGLASPAVLLAYLVDAAGAEYALGTLTVNADGTAHGEADWCEGDPLPLGATTWHDLMHLALVVRDDFGQVVFEGALPGAGPHGEGPDPDMGGGGMHGDEPHPPRPMGFHH